MSLTHEEVEKHLEAQHDTLEMVTKNQAAMGGDLSTVISRLDSILGPRNAPKIKRAQIEASPELLEAAQKRFFAEYAVRSGLVEEPKKPIDGWTIAGYAAGVALTGGALYGAVRYFRNRSAKKEETVNV